MKQPEAWPSARTAGTLCPMTDDEWKKLRSTIKGGVAEGVILAGLVLLLLNFALGMVMASVRL